MKLFMDGREYHAETAVGLVDQIKGEHWQAGEDATTEEYIAVQERTFKVVRGRKLRLPAGDTEARALAMFREIAKTGAWDFTEGE